MKYTINHISVKPLVTVEIDGEGKTRSVQLGLAIKTAFKSGAYLGGAYLGGAYLGGAYLRGADLRGADLRGADLSGADLSGADLRGTDLRGAYLRGTDLRGAYLRGADLRGADLSGAYLRGAYLRGADLRGADLRGADLSGAKIDDGLVISKIANPIQQLGPIGSRNDYFFAFHTEQGIYLSAGCFFGSVPEFKRKLKESHGNNHHAANYKAALQFIETVFKNAKKEENK